MKLAGLAWIACLQFFLAEFVCAWRFGSVEVANSPASRHVSYSYFENYISDLGAATCRPGEVCSGLHDLMNASFLLQGGLIAGGAALLWSRLARDFRSRTALICLMLSAFGVALVGLAPEDVAPTLHYVGAGLNLIPCNLAMLFFATTALRPPLPRSVFGVSGALGLAGVVGSALHVDLGLGVGGMGRIAAYPFVLTLSSCGFALLRAEAFTSQSGPAVRPGFPAA